MNAYWSCCFVGKATGTNTLKWNYKAGDGSYRLMVVGEVGWGQVIFDRYNGLHVVQQGTTSVVTFIDV